MFAPSINFIAYRNPCLDVNSDSELSASEPEDRRELPDEGRSDFEVVVAERGLDTGLPDAACSAFVAWSVSFSFFA
jgi:hypothetical protein